MAISIQGFLNNKELFSVRSVSKGLNMLPFRAGLIGRLGWFQEQGIPGSLSIVERRFTNIQLLSPHRRGGAAHAFDISRRAGIPVEVPQYDTVANAYQELRGETAADRIDAFRTTLYGGGRRGNVFTDAYIGYTKDWHKTQRETTGGVSSGGIVL
jgi:hypothetical protein